MYMLVWIMFLVAGMALGGAWTAYKNDSKLWTIIAALVGVVATVTALSWLVAEMGAAA